MSAHYLLLLAYVRSNVCQEQNTKKLSLEIVTFKAKLFSLLLLLLLPPEKTD